VWCATPQFDGKVYINSLCLCTRSATAQSVRDKTANLLARLNRASKKRQKNGVEVLKNARSCIQTVENGVRLNKKRWIAGETWGAALASMNDQLGLFSSLKQDFFLRWEPNALFRLNGWHDTYNYW
jgi:hypothetical protein